MKKIIIGIAVLAMAATLLDSCSSCSSRRQAAETELNDSTKAAKEMEEAMTGVWGSFDAL